jgi:hypothetical protein
MRIFQEHLKRAQNLGYRQDEIERQVLLMRIQSAILSPELEKQAEQLIQDSEKYTGPRMDLFLDEFYEARAKGYVANYRLLDAEIAIDHWITARPNSIPARMRPVIPITSRPVAASGLLNAAFGPEKLPKNTGSACRLAGGPAQSAWRNVFRSNGALREGRL